MDKPLKYFLIISGVFVFLIGTFILGTLTQEKTESPNEYAVVDENDQYMLSAKKQAAAMLDTFLNLYPRHIDSSFVRFSFEPTKGHIEHLWGKVHKLDSLHVHVQLKRKQGLEDIYYPDELELRVDRIEDWMIQLENGNIRGGYTAQAMLLQEKERPLANIDSLQSQLGKFSDKLN
jgi:uncharacterized protein YegJ (DUF2314 family)